MSDKPEPIELDAEPAAAVAPELLCDVCGRAAVGVASSSFGAISFAFCGECAAKPAEPAWMFGYLYEEVGDHGDGLAGHVNDFWTWKDGAYLSWPEYRDGRRAALAQASAK